MPLRELLKLDPNEKIIHEVKRHPIGLWGIYFGTALGVAGMVLLTYFVYNLQGDLQFSLPAWLYVTAFGLVMLSLAAFAVVGTIVYESNELVVTDQNLMQILRYSLFNRQLSQLNLAKIQDVSVDQKGILQTYFNYGTIEVETAGEASNFRFPYAPDPNKAAKIIIEAHEDFVRTSSRHPSAI